MRKPIWIDLAACILLLSILAAHVVRDPSPWTEQFYDSARFDGQLALAGLFVQAANGRHVEHLLWPGLPMVAMAGILVDLGNLDGELLDDGPRPVPDTVFYATLDRVSRAANLLGFLGVALWVVGTYFLLARLYDSRLGAFTIAAYLAASQVAATNLGWVRSEAWSLAFLCLAMLAVAPGIRSWLRNQPPADATRLHLFVFGLLAGSAILSRINVVPAVGLLSALCLFLCAKQPIPDRTPSGRVFLWAALPLILLPWWAFVFPSEEFRQSLSAWDAETAALLKFETWRASMAALTLLTLVPLGIVLTVTLLRRRSTNQHPQRDSWGATGLGLAQLLSGGLAAFLAWTTLISRSLPGVYDHLRHLLVTLPVSLTGGSQYMGERPGLLQAWSYFLDSGAQLGRPNAGDFFAGSSESAGFWRWVNPSTLALAAGLLSLFLLLTPLRKQAPFRRCTYLAWGAILLLFGSEYLAAARGVFIDFRYYTYGGWFALMAIAATGAGVAAGLRSPAEKRILEGTLAVASVLLVLHAWVLGIPAASQHALYGRQIALAPGTVPGIFEETGVEPDNKDWQYLLERMPIDFREALETEAAQDPAFRNDFAWETWADGTLRIEYTGNAEPKRLTVRLPVPEGLPGGRPEQKTIDLAIRAELEREDGPAGAQPVIGLQLRPRKGDGKPVSYWAVISSSWNPEIGSVEFAREIDVDLLNCEPAAVLTWQANYPGDAFLIRGALIGIARDGAEPAPFSLGGDPTEKPRTETDAN